MRLILLGPPGAGKGTQAKLISRQFKLLHISTGDILREAVKNKTTIGIEAEKYVNKGELVPDEIVIRLVVDRLQADELKSGFILDGFPRTKEQAVSLDKYLEELKIPIEVVLNFDTSKETIISRLAGRRICRQCGSNYHIVNIPPKKQGLCDECGGSLYQRDDDKEETVLNRLEVYEKQTAELIKYYKQREILETVSGDLNVDELNEVLKRLFAKYGVKQ